MFKLEGSTLRVRQAVIAKDFISGSMCFYRAFRKKISEINSKSQLKFQKMAYKNEPFFFS